ncbi:MAG: hypothetical protein M1816_002863 [Peltula sp. TS41687]|nr:MAG: hypothetical protein M1816_002863 [Peltula sp. TS41687]
MTQRRRGLSAPVPPSPDQDRGFLCLQKQRRSQEASTVAGFGVQRKATGATLKDDILICKTLLWRDLTPGFQRIQQSEKVFNQLSIAKNLVQSHLEALEKEDLPPMESLKVLQEIRLQRFLLDYGDYLTSDLDPLRRELKFKSSSWNQTAANWGRVIEVLDQRVGERTVEHDKMKNDLLYAVGELDCDFELLKFQIRTYAERNRIAHSNLRYLIATYKWDRLAQFILRDREELPSLIPLSRYSDLREFEKVLDRAEKKFFKVLEPGYFELRRKEKEDKLENEQIRLAKKRTDSERRSRQVSENKESAKKRREASGSDDTKNAKGEGGLTDDAVDYISVNS